MDMRCAYLHFPIGVIALFMRRFWRAHFHNIQFEPLLRPRLFFGVDERRLDLCEMRAVRNGSNFS